MSGHLYGWLQILFLALETVHEPDCHWLPALEVHAVSLSEAGRSQEVRMLQCTSFNPMQISMWKFFWLTRACQINWMLAISIVLPQPTHPFQIIVSPQLWVVWREVLLWPWIKRAGLPLLVSVDPFRAVLLLLFYPLCARFFKTLKELQDYWGNHENLTWFFLN